MMYLEGKKCIEELISGAIAKFATMGGGFKMTNQTLQQKIDAEFENLVIRYINDSDAISNKDPVVWDIRHLFREATNKALQEFREQIGKSTNYYWTNDGEPWLQKKDVLALLGEKKQ